MNVYCSAKVKFRFIERNQKRIVLICDAYTFLSTFFKTRKVSEIFELMGYIEKYQGNTLKLDLRVINVRQIKFRTGPAISTFKGILQNTVQSIRRE